jgi:drug/metabolite transporter (DMT)-like permease
MKGNERKQALVLLVIGAVIISFSPIIVKLLGRDTIGPTAIAFWRTFIGGVVLVAIALFQKQTLKLAKGPAVWCLFTGLCFSLDLNFWHHAILYIGAGMSTLIGNTQVFATALVSHFIFKEKLTRRFLIAAPAAVIGLALLIGIFSQTVEFTPLYVRGVIFSIFTALLYAAYMLGVKKATIHPTGPGAASIMAWICLSASVFLVVLSALAPEPFWPPDMRALGFLLVLGILGQAIAWWGIAWAMKRIAIHHTALILLMQPVLSILWGFLLFGEALVHSQIIGAAITLSAIYAGSIRRKRSA